MEEIELLKEQQVPKRAAPRTPSRSRRRVSSLVDVPEICGPVPKRRAPETPSKGKTSDTNTTLPLHTLLDKKHVEKMALTKAQQREIDYLKICAINIIERSLAEVDYFVKRGDRLESDGRRLATRVLYRFFKLYRKRLLRASLRSWNDQMKLMKQASSLKSLSTMTSSLEKFSGSFDSAAVESRRIRTIPSPSPRRVWRKTPKKSSRPLSINTDEEGK